MKKIFLILYALSIFCLTILGFLDENIIYNTSNILFHNLFTFLYKFKFWTAISLGLYIVVYTLFPQWILSNKEKNRLKKDMLSRINIELFGKDLEQHRITLFRETNWCGAVFRNYWYLIYHYCLYRHKYKLYWPLPKIGRYLIIDNRCGLHFERSSTMLRIETNRPEMCNGIAGYIRYRRGRALAVDLPDINDIDFSNVSSIDEIRPKSRQDDVRRYMRKGAISDFKVLRKMHRKARHFYGTYIEKKDGKPQGVLLVDSTSETNPFTDEIKRRFDSFALSISGIINMEV